MSHRILFTSLTLALLVGCSSGSRSDGTSSATAAPPATTNPTSPTSPTSPTTPTTPTTPTGTLPTNPTLTAVGTPTGGLPVISDLVEFDGRLWLMESLDPLAQFGAQIWTWDATNGFTKVLDDPTSQGYLRGKVYGGKLYVPDGDANGLTPGIVYIFDSASGTPQSTTVDSAVHNFDVVERNGELFTSGATDNGASSLHRFDPNTNRWTVVSQGNFSRLKYMALMDGNILATKRTIGSAADLVSVDAAFAQAGVTLLQGAEALVVCMEAIGGSVYASLSSSAGTFHVRLEPGQRVTQLTGISGAILFDYVQHSDGNIYAVGSDLAGRSFVYGSTDGVDFTRIVDVGDLRFGRVGNNADGRPSIASYQGKLYAGSSTNGTLYRLD